MTVRLPSRQDALAYWRSSRHRAGGTGLGAEIAREFPEDASSPPGISRRGVLKLMGASMALAGAACRRPVETIVPYADPPEEVVPGVPRSYATTMPFGLSAYGLVVESHEGRPTKVEGNELHPATRGCSTALMQASILSLYDPDRSRQVTAGGEVSSFEAAAGFLAERAARHEGDGGRGLAVLTEPFSSPTLARLRDELLARFPSMRFVAWEPAGEENVHAGLAAATGSAHRLAYRFDRARIVLALDADPLLLDPEAASNARGFAARRRLASESDDMSRLWAVESAYSVTGAAADHRMRLRSGRIPAFLAALAAELERGGLGVPGGAPAAPLPPDVDPAWLAAVADDLLASRGEGLIVAGPWQPPEVHAAVYALNEALGQVGTTVVCREMTDAAPPSTPALRDLATAMANGAVETLVILGGNPVYDAPADIGFGEALGGVSHTLHLAAARDETSAVTAWHVPRAHFLESWGDARSADGTPSVVQPLIEPLHGGRTEIDVLAAMLGDEPPSAHDAVRATWRSLLGEDAFEARWHRVLHDGLLPGAGPGRTPPARSGLVAALGAAAGTSGLEVVFRPGFAVHDGRFANNGWLQEAPDPVTKLTWGNAALMSPSTMRSAGVANEDVVRVSLDGRDLVLPAWEAPGQAEGTVVLTLGYGRTAAGRVGDGVGSSVYPLRSSGALWAAAGATVEATGDHAPLACTQDHGTMAGRPIVRESTLEGWRARPHFAAEAVEHPPLEQTFDDHDYSRGHQWGMAIDLTTCIGCNACVLACQSENNIPVVGKDQVRRGREMHWIRVDRYFAEPSAGHRDEGGDGGERHASGAPGARGDLADARVVFQPVPCMHCENAPCEQVCPVAATVHDREGLNVMVYNRCIGTRYCSNNCPYKVRRFNFYNFTKDMPEVVRLAMNPDVTIRSRGVMEKCTYCIQRISRGRIRAKLDERRLADGDVRTACQQACPAGAISFGDLLGVSSEVAAWKARSRNYELLAELNNRPRTSYLARVRNPHPELS